jgi:hypothetical protein
MRWLAVVELNTEMKPEAEGIKAHWQHCHGINWWTLRAGYCHSAPHDRNRRSYFSGEVEFTPALRRLSPSSRKISKVLDGREL